MTLPPKRFASCPDEGRILEYYDGIFDCVYVLLSPFQRVVGMPMARFDEETWPTRREIREGCEPVSWETVRSAAGLTDLAAVDVGLKTDIHALRKIAAVPAFADALTKVADRERLLAPCEGEHADLLHDEILHLIRSMGHERVWVADECGEKETHHDIEDLLAARERVIERSNVFAADHSLLWTVHWDSHFSFLCSTSRQRLETAGVQDFEGFFCTEATTVSWSLDGP